MDQPVTALFEAPTVPGLAARAAAWREERLRERLALVEGLSDAEVEALLREG